MNLTGKPEIGSQIRVDIYRIPKKNHDTMVQTQKQFVEAFRKYGCYYQSFQLNNDHRDEGFTSISNTVAANRGEEEVWMDVESYTDRKHMDSVISKIMSDERALSLMKSFLDLLSPEFTPIRTEFSRVGD